MQAPALHCAESRPDLADDGQSPVSPLPSEEKVADLIPSARTASRLGVIVTDCRAGR